MKRITIEEIRALAETAVSKEIWESIGRFEGELIFEQNRAILEKIYLNFRAIHDLHTVNTRFKILGKTVKTPIIAAPLANIGKLHPQAEIAAAKGAEKAGAMMFIGSESTNSPKKVVRAVSVPVVWVGKSTENRKKLIKQMNEAEESGCSAIGICMNSFIGMRINERRHLLSHVSLSAKEIETLRRETSLPFVLVGITAVEDALEAMNAGVNAIVVASHGKELLQHCQPSLQLLPHVAKAVYGSVEVIIDGGFQTGADILKALALGARACFVSWPIYWGLASSGANGVARVLEVITQELVKAMILTNIPDVNNVRADSIILK